MTNKSRLVPVVRSLLNRTSLLGWLSGLLCVCMQMSCGSKARFTDSNCIGLVEAECRSHAECTAVTASALDRTSCVSSDAFMECAASTSPSCQWASSFRDSDGRCWTTGGCPSTLPAGWKLDLSCGSEYVTARETCSGGKVDSGEPEVDGGTGP